MVRRHVAPLETDPHRCRRVPCGTATSLVPGLLRCRARVHVRPLACSARVWQDGLVSETTTTVTYEVPTADPDTVCAVFPGFANVYVFKTPSAYLVQVQQRNRYVFVPETVAETWVSGGEETYDFAAACAVAVAWANAILEANV